MIFVMSTTIFGCMSKMQPFLVVPHILWTGADSPTCPIPTGVDSSLMGVKTPFTIRDRGAGQVNTHEQGGHILWGQKNTGWKIGHVQNV